MGEGVEQLGSAGAGGPSSYSGRDCRVRNRYVLTKIVFVREKGCRFSKSGFGSRRVQCDRHHLLPITIIELSTGAAPPYLQSPAFRFSLFAFSRKRRVTFSCLRKPPDFA
jgi:hypothetical protein